MTEPLRVLYWQMVQTLISASTSSMVDGKSSDGHMVGTLVGVRSSWCIEFPHSSNIHWTRTYCCLVRDSHTTSSIKQSDRNSAWLIRVRTSQARFNLSGFFSGFDAVDGCHDMPRVKSIASAHGPAYQLRVTHMLEHETIFCVLHWTLVFRLVKSLSVCHVCVIIGHAKGKLSFRTWEYMLPLF
jgi:hypothetical protein